MTSISLKHYFLNTFWIIGEKATSIAVGFFFLVILARYLGPVDFGILSYATSISSLFAVAGHMGLSGLIIREIVKNPEERGLILGTTLGLKFAGMVLGYLLLLIYAVSYEGIESVEFTVVAIAGAVLLFKPFEIIDFWFQAFVQAKYVAFSLITGLAISSFLKLLFVILSLNIYFFAAANVIQSVVIAAVFVLFYNIKSNLKLAEWHFSWAKAKELLNQGWIVYLGAIFAIIYMKVDQVMLRWFEGSEAVGVYAVAAQLSEAWYFVPTAIMASFFPKLINLREQDLTKFNERLQQLFDLLFILSLGTAVVMSLLSEWLITLFFGAHYIDSAGVLVIHIWAAIFIFMRAAFSKWILIEGALMLSMITQGSGALINVVLNYFLIPRFGVQGAAYATLISYAFASFFSLLIFDNTRPIFFMMLRSIFSPFRYARVNMFR